MWSVCSRLRLAWTLSIDALPVQLVPDLAGQHAVLAAGLHHLADERLAVAVAVGGRGVDVVDALVQRGVERRMDHLAARPRTADPSPSPVHVGKGRAADRDRRDLEAGSAERSFLHGLPQPNPCTKTNAGRPLPELWKLTCGTDVTCTSDVPPRMDILSALSLYIIQMYSQEEASFNGPRILGAGPAVGLAASGAWADTLKSA